MDLVCFLDGVCARIKYFPSFMIVQGTSYASQYISIMSKRCNFANFGVILPKVDYKDLLCPQKSTVFLGLMKNFIIRIFVLDYLAKYLFFWRVIKSSLLSFTDTFA